MIGESYRPGGIVTFVPDLASCLLAETVRPACTVGGRLGNSGRRCFTARSFSFSPQNISKMSLFGSSS